MSFRDFTFPEVCDTFGLTLRQELLYPTPPRFDVGETVRRQMARGLRVSQGLNNEKARSEFVVGPLLLEMWAVAGEQFGLFSGWELNVDPANGLNGTCDFLLSRDPLVLRLRAPVLAIVEAKNDNVRNGFAQCVATMYAAALFNAKHKVPDGVVHGCSTTGRDWKFFRLDGTTITIDAVEYAVPLQLDEIAGILLSIVGGPADPQPQE